MNKKEKVICRVLEKWFENRQTMTKENYSILNDTINIIDEEYTQDEPETVMAAPEFKKKSGRAGTSKSGSIVYENVLNDILSLADGDYHSTDRIKEILIDYGCKKSSVAYTQAFYVDFMRKSGYEVDILRGPDPEFRITKKPTVKPSDDYPLITPTAVDRKTVKNWGKFKAHGRS